MKISRNLLLVSPLVGALHAAGCGDSDPPFLPLADLCDVYAEEVCDGREACCRSADAGSASFDRDVCETSVRAACKADVDLLTNQGDLSYDGQDANRVRGQLQDALDQCSAPLPLGKFFHGTRGNGELCQDAAQCQSVTCAVPASGTAMVCSDPAGNALCEPADI